MDARELKIARNEPSVLRESTKTIECLQFNIQKLSSHGSII
jgi:hypothetical protein